VLSGAGGGVLERALYVRLDLLDGVVAQVRLQGEEEEEE
jgi:hypothetical protein